MQIETYEVEEVTGELGNMAADAECAELIAKLGLTGQQKLLHTDTCTRFPYRLMTLLEHKVYSKCFPERIKVEDYSESIIPVRVLQVAAFCKETHPEEWFGVYVWHCGSAKEDPLLVGHTSTTSTYGGKFYLLARWGDALASFEALAVKAKAIWKSRAQAKISKEMADWRADQEGLDLLGDELFLTGKIVSGHNGYTLADL